jgi:hypothetical protein
MNDKTFEIIFKCLITFFIIICSISVARYLFIDTLFTLTMIAFVVLIFSVIVIIYKIWRD